MFICLVVEHVQVGKVDLSKSVQLNQEVLDSCKVIHAAWNEITKVWTLPVIHSLGLKEPARFNELKRRIEGISATSLAERLTELERLGVVARTVYPETPPRVEYSLTQKGVELKQVLGQLADWAIRWAQKTAAAEPKTQ
jgi:DNA-binding HxlR family transcriptional regulator